MSVHPSAPTMQWMPVPPPLQGVPRGLEYLARIDQLIVKQKVELLEAFIGFETSNKYEVKNSIGQNVYFALEDSDCCTRQCCGANRAFDMRILDNAQQEVVHLERPFRCDSCCFPCCLQEMVISSPGGNTLGFIHQLWDCLRPRFDILNANQQSVLTIEGPICACNLCGDVDFEVMSKDQQVIGKISKHWSGILKEAFADADNFGIQFPMDLDVKIKAVLLGAVFLIWN